MLRDAPLRGAPQHEVFVVGLNSTISAPVGKTSGYSRRNSCSKFSRSRQNRQGIAHAPACQAVGRSVPASSARVALHGRLRRAERAVVADLAEMAPCSGLSRSRTVRGRLALSRPVGREANRPAFTAHLSTRPLTPMLPSVSVAESPAALQHAEVLLRPSVGRQRRRWGRRRLGDRRRGRLGRLEPACTTPPCFLSRPAARQARP